MQPEEGFAYFGLPDLRAVHIGAKDSNTDTRMEEIRVRKFPFFFTLHKFYSERAVSLLSFSMGYFHLRSVCSSELPGFQPEKSNATGKSHLLKICSLKAIGEASKLPSQPSVLKSPVKQAQRQSVG